ncbi:hypothetical protein Tco_0516355 [Tanacetum coccineum]
MATEPNELRRETIRRLRQELVDDVELANNLLHELNRYLDQLRTRALELLRVEALPDDPLINGKYDMKDPKPKHHDVDDVELANNLLHELNRYLDQLRTRAPELLRVEALPDDPLIK